MAFETDIAVSSPGPRRSYPLKSSPELEAALALLMTGDFQERWEAAKRITAVGKSAIAPLVRLIEDEDLDWEVRWFAARALGYLEDVEALEGLIEILQRAQEPELIAITADGLSRFGAAGVDALEKLLAQPAHRIIAIQALAGIRHEAALGPLMTGAYDKDAQVRTVAISALGSFRNPQVDQILMEAVRDSSASVRREAIVHLGLRHYLLDTMDLVTTLRTSLLDLDLGVSQVAASSLGRLGTEAAVVGLAQMLQSPHTPEPLKVSIVRALGWIEQDSALSTLLASRQSATIPVQVEIIDALARFQSQALRHQASEALGNWLETLETAAAVGPVKRAIALALGQLQHQAATPLLRRLIQDPDAQTSLYAEAALRQLSSLS